MLLLALVASATSNLLPTYCYNISDLSASCNVSANECDNHCALYQIVAYSSKCPRSCSTACYVIPDKKHEFELIRDNDHKPELPHWLVIPRLPVIGVEDPARPNEIWDVAWNLTVSGKDSMPAFKPIADIGLAINPASYRTQHQMHVHLGYLQKYLRTALNKKDVSSKTWSSISALSIIPAGCPSTVFNASTVQYRARFYADHSLRTVNVYTEVAKLVGEAEMVRHGIVVAGTQDGSPGFFIAVAPVFFAAGQICLPSVQPGWRDHMDACKH